MHLLAPTVLRVAPQELPARVRARFENGLRRAGSFAQLCLLGAQACLDAGAGEGRLGVLWSSKLGALKAIRSGLDDSLRRGEPVMPFTFIAMQPHLAGALLAQRGHPVSRSAHVHLAGEDWPLLLQAARGWLAECERVLLGWVEESDAPQLAHRSDWCLLQRAPSAAAVRCEPAAHADAALAATAEDWIARIAAWRAAPHSPLLLRAGEEAWRFVV
jgi:hypothetical protein